MPAPHAIECPICFTSMKLKAAPKLGMRVKCRDCGSVFMHGAEPTSMLPDEEPEDDEPARSGPVKKKAAGKGKKKSAGKGMSGGMIAGLVGGGLALVLLIGGIALWGPISQALAALSRPTLDITKLDLPGRQLVADIRLGELLSSPLLPADTKTKPEFVQASTEFQQFLGVRLEEVEWIRILATSPGPMAFMSQTPNGIMILRAGKNLTRPTVSPFQLEDYPCYRLEQTATQNPLGFDTMAFANDRTIVLGGESSVRAALQLRKQGQTPVGLPTESAKTVQASIAGQQSPMPVGQLRMLSAMGGGAPDPSFDQAVQTIETGIGATILELDLKSTLAISVGFQPKSPVTVQQLQTSLEQVRLKLATAFEQLANSPMAGSVPGLKTMQPAVNSTFQVSGDRALLSFTLNPADFPTGAGTPFGAMPMPSFAGLKAVTGTASTSTASTATMPAMPTMPNPANPAASTPMTAHNFTMPNTGAMPNPAAVPPVAAPAQ